MKRRLAVALVTACGCAAGPAAADDPPTLGPFTLGEVTATVAFDDVTVPGPPGYGDTPMLQWERADVGLDVAGMLSGATHITRVDMDGARLTLVRDAAGTWNLVRFRRDLLAQPALAEQPAPAEAGDPAADSLAVDVTAVRNGTIVIVDESVGDAPATFRFANVEASVEHLARPMAPARRDTTVNLRADWEGAAGGTLTVAGNGNFMQPRKSFDLHAEIRGVPVVQFRPYYRRRSINLLDGTLDADIAATCRDNVLDANIAVTIYSLRVEQTGRGVSDRLYGMTSQQFVQLVQARQGNFTVNFTMRGDLGDPKFDADASAADLFGKAATNTLALTAEALAKTGELIIDTVRGPVRRELRDVTDALRGR